MTEIFARNFDFEAGGEFAGFDGDEGGAIRSIITLAEAEKMAEQARKAGYEEGSIAGAARALSEERASRTARCDEAIVALSNSLFDIGARDQRLRAELGLELAELITDVAERLIPDLFEGNIGDLLVARVNAGIRVAAGEGRVTIKVPPELAEEITPRLEALTAAADNETVQFKIIADESIDDWTIRMSWRNGSLEYDPAFASAEALDALKEAILELRTQLESMP